jgi:hypothetical protein
MSVSDMRDDADPDIASLIRATVFANRANEERKGAPKGAPFSRGDAASLAAKSRLRDRIGTKTGAS